MNLWNYAVRERKGPPGAVCNNVRECIRVFKKPWCFDDLLCPAKKKIVRRVT